MGKSKSKLRLTNISCHTYSKKEYWIPKYLKKRKSKAKQTKSGSSVYVVIELFRNWKVRKIFITICNGHKIGQVDMVSIINTVNGVFFYCTITFHIFLKQCLFSLYHTLTNNKYITVGRYYYISVTNIGSITLTMILPNSI